MKVNILFTSIGRRVELINSWKKAYAESTENGKLVKEIINHIMEPTDYSPIR